MIERSLTATIRDSLELFPVVGLVGSRQAGKTTLAKGVAASLGGSIHLDLERPSDLARLSEPEMFLERHAEVLVVIDEVQRRPDLFPTLRALCDTLDRPGRFLLLGSASPDLLRQSSESLAGRIVYHELFPFSVAEVGVDRAACERLWLRGGYPRSFLAATDRASLAWRRAFISTYLERDLPQLGVQIPAPQLRRFWLMLAHLHGQVWNASRIAVAIGVTPPTATHYLAVLEQTFTARRLQPWRSNLGKRLVKTPKVYFRDTGLLHALLGITSHDALLGHPVLGASFEGLVVEQVAALVQDTFELSFYRTAAGAEIDLVLTQPGKPPIAIEAKATSSPALSRGFREAFADLGCRHGLVVVPGGEPFPLATGIDAIPIAELDTHLKRCLALSP
jgi:hypothetical protein